MVIGDFGYAIELDADTRLCSRLGSPAYVAPEIFMGYLYDQSIDIYAFGKLCGSSQSPSAPAIWFQISRIDAKPDAICMPWWRLITKDDVIPESLQKKFKSKDRSSSSPAPRGIETRYLRR